MKKLSAYLVIALLTIGFVGCKKNFTCQCSYTYEIMELKEINQSEIQIKDTRKKAEEKCKNENYSDSGTTLGETYTEKLECKLK